MSRSWTEEECREIGRELKARGIIPFDYDEFREKLDNGEIFIEQKEIAKNKSV